MGRVACLFAALTSSLLLTVAFPPWNLGFLAWIWCVPLFLACRQQHWLLVFLAWNITGTSFFFSLLGWAFETGTISPAGFVIGITLSGCYFGTFGVLAEAMASYRVAFRVTGLAASWTLFEYVRSQLGFLALPWGLLGYTQGNYPTIAATAAVGSVFLVSFLVQTTNVSIANILNGFIRNEMRLRDLWPSILWLLVPVGIALTPTSILQEESSIEAQRQSRFLVGATQGNVSWDSDNPLRSTHTVWTIYRDLTIDAAADGAQLVVWPSGTLPSNLEGNVNLTNGLSSLAHDAGIWLLVGTTTAEKFHAEDKPPEAANTTWLVSPSGVFVERYDKIRLLPFDEYLPMRNLIPWPAWIANDTMIDFQPGTRHTAFDANGHSFGVAICWENFFPDLVRKNVREMDFLVSMTNEAFAASETAHEQMLLMNIFRAIENGISIVRTAPTGITAIISPEGRVVRAVAGPSGARVGVAGWIVSPLPGNRRPTLYSRYGNWFLAVCCVVCTVIFFLHGRQTYSRRSNARSAGSDDAGEMIPLGINHSSPARNRGRSTSHQSTRSSD